ncbi:MULTISPECIES: VirB4 family type IV secretion system protein [Microbispora]|uniref:Conjugal transfer protein TraC n=3 Tax=Microbispora TaxID=2005 RepID=A0ABY3LT66_9ACTN|nr:MULTISPECIES: ATP-binding protein [Microbispora]KAA9375977.1 conjugal transfer protein TraC [Microbispora cellulosiformans]TLP57867.1 conjugal transfer protein TraC [Microbispora fusca]TYB52335.1 conjugal transfer protein TraC [Microbispora tritici]
MKLRRTTEKRSAFVHPNALGIGARTLTFPDGATCAFFAVTGYPREVGAGWLEPLLTYPGRLDVCLHIEPIPQAVAAMRLRRQLARLESSSQADTQQGRLQDFDTEAAADDATELAASLARGHGRLFKVGLYLTVHAASQEDLTAEVERVRTLAASLLLDAQPTTFRALQGWASCLPFATDAIGLTRSFDTTALAAAFPFTSPDLPVPTSTSAVLYGLSASSSGVVLWDRFAQDNHNSVTLAQSGAGKSFFTKLETLRLLYQGVEVAVVDPEDEYARLAHAVGGTYLRLGATGVRWNPLDLPASHGPRDDVLARRALFLQTLIATMLGQASLGPHIRATLDTAVLTTYAEAGITRDPATWSRPAPLLGDLVTTLTGHPQGEDIAVQLAPYVTGSYRELFDGPTTTHPSGHLIVFSLRDLPEEMKAVGTLLALDAIWRRVANPRDRRKRLVVVDEAWLLMREDAGARFLFRMAKAARKHWAGLAVVTQDAADLLGSELGQAIVANAAGQILLRQAPQAIGAIGATFGLSEGERQFLLTAERGEALLVAGPASRIAFQVIASPIEAELITTDPAELAELARRESRDGPTPTPFTSTFVQDEDEEDGDPL